MKRLVKLLLSRTSFILLLLLAQIAFFFVTIDFLTSFPYVNTALYVITTIIVIFLIYKEENPAYKLSWIVPIMVFPLFGGLFYLFYQNTNVSRRVVRLLGNIDQERIKFLELPLPVSTSKVANYLSHLGFASYGETDITFYDSGPALFNAMKEAMQQATTSIYIEFFIIRKGQMWSEFLEILTKKAKQGVDIKIIYDDFGSATLPYRYPKKLKALGIDAYSFNPMSPHLNFQMNYRSHRKHIIIDNDIGFTGGINVGDEYIDLKRPFGHWQDSGIKLVGDAAKMMAINFIDQLRFTTQEQVALPYPKIDQQSLNLKALTIPFVDAPIDKHTTNKNVYLQIIHEAKHTLYITTPYLIIDYELLEALKFAKSSGVDVKIIIPRKPDKRLVYMVTESYARELSQAGIDIYKYSPGFIHSKMMIADGHTAMIGSCNLDYRSLYLHFENSVYLRNHEEIAKIEAHFHELIQVSENLKNFKRRPVFYRIIQIILRGFSSVL